MKNPSGKTASGIIGDAHRRGAGGDVALPRQAGEFRARTWLTGLLIVTALVLAPSLANDFVLDDVEQIVRNRYLGGWRFVWKGFTGDVLWYRNPSHPLQSGYYRPLYNLWLWLNFKLFGLHAIGWHAASIALYLLIVLLVYRVASVLVEDRAIGLLAAALFALMPVHAQAVAYPAAGATLLAAAFQLGAFESFLRGRRGASLALFGAALLSYEGAVAFPPLIAAYALLVSQRRTYVRAQSRAPLAAAWPYFLELAGYLALRYWALGLGKGSAGGTTLTAVFLRIPAAIASYLALIAMPWRAGPAHRLVFATGLISPGFYFPAAGIGLLGLAAVLLARRSTRRPLYVFCLSWFFIALAPMLTLVAFSAPGAIEDRYLLLASFGPCVTAAGLAIEFARTSLVRAKTVGIGVVALAVVWASSLVYVQRYWRDEAALFTQCIEEEPDSAASHAGLGMAFVARGKFADARRELQTAVKLRPRIGAPIFYDLALVDQRLGDSRTAAAEMSEWLRRLTHPTPDDCATVALFADAAGDSAGTEAALAEAATMPGGAAAASVARAEIAFRHGDRKDAEDALRGFVAGHPADSQARMALAGVLASNKHPRQALAELRLAAAARPQDPNLHYRIAALLHRLGRDHEARKECASALASAPYDPDARALMAAIERGMNRP
ncbi:MAG: tetratricopeptide repeat protein [Candidatus Binataceae bacterium]